MKRIISIFLLSVMFFNTFGFALAFEEPVFATSVTPMISMGEWHSAALKSDGTMWAWGGNLFGQIGDGTTTWANKFPPVSVSNLTNVTQIDIGGYSSAALKNDGTVWMWGNNSYGELGDGTTTYRNTPVRVSGLTNITQISMGGRISAALKNDGTVWMWGNNSKGALGDGTTTDRHTPVRVSGLTNVTQISMGGAHAAALKSDGTVWTWGHNFAGAIGDGTTTDKHTPVRVSDLTNVTQISMGGNTSAALKSDGTVWTWGHNFAGAIGDGTTTDKHTPVRVSDLTDVTQISIGSFHSAALKKDGTVWTWGGNQNGQLGDGTTTNKTTPVRVPSLTNVTQISIGTHHSAALKSNGTVWTWGFNHYGQIGDGTTTDRTTPVLVQNFNLNVPTNDDFVVSYGTLVEYKGTDEHVVIPSNMGIGGIADYAFSSNTNIKSVYIPSGVTCIGDYAFANCINLNTVKLPTSIGLMGTGVFANTSIPNPIFIHNGQMLCYVPSWYNNYIIPSKVTDIIDGAFYGCSQLQSIAIPMGVKIIRDSTFKNCSSLTSVYIPDSTIVIADEAFRDCKALTAVTIPSKVTSIGQRAFYGCTKLHTIIMPDSISEIENATFSNCPALTIYGQSDSYVQQYASTNSIPFSTDAAKPTTILNSEGDVILIDLSKYDEFPYFNNEYNHDLAVECGKLASYSYEKYKYDDEKKIFYEKGTDNKDNLKNILKGKTENYKDVVPKDLGKDNDNGANFTFGHKTVNFNGVMRELTVVVIDGTQRNQWYGNMDVLEDWNVHPSFLSATNSIHLELLKYLTNPNEENEDDAITNSLILITGHSRGAGVGNLLAHRLTTAESSNLIDSDGIYAYLFAPPNSTTEPNSSLSNIYNFCFTDDFVTNFPLNVWGYRLHGQTKRVSAQELYAGNSSFNSDMRAIIKKSTDRNKPDFNLKATTDIYDHIGKNWSTVWAYYNIPTWPQITLYEYLHDYLAGYLSDNTDKLLFAGQGMFNLWLWPVFGYLVEQTKFRAHNYLYDTHQMYTYYAALKTGYFDFFSSSNLSDVAEPVSLLSVGVPDEANEAEITVLKNIANTGDNLSNLGWNLEDLSTWEGVTWDAESGHIKALDFYFKSLSGSLDFSNFPELESINVTGNNFTDILLSTSGELKELYVSNNLLTELDLSNQIVLTAIDCTQNYLDLEVMSDIFNTFESNGVLLNYSPQNILPEATYDSDDLSALSSIFADNDNWDITDSPDTWAGVTWEKQNDIYRAVSLDISELGFSGELNVSGLSALTSLNCFGNMLTALNASGCGKLSWLNCSDNMLTSITLNASAPLEVFQCENNYLDISQLSDIIDAVENIEGGIVLTGHQYISTSISDFCDNEYGILSNLAVDMGWDINTPGEWDEVSWVLVGDTYYVESLNLDLQESLNGVLDLSTFSNLKNLSLSDTGFSAILLPSSISEIQDSAFQNCASLTTISLPENLTTIGTMAFKNCGNMETVLMPAGLLAIGDSAFYDCKALTNVRIPASVTEVGEKAFAGCSELESVVFLGSMINEIGESIFAETPTNLKIGYFSSQNYESNPVLESIGAASFGNLLIGGWCQFVDGILTVTLASSSMIDSEISILIVVNEGRKLKSIKSYSIVLSDAVGKVAVDNFSDYSDFDYRVFIFDGISTLAPLSKSL